MQELFCNGKCSNEQLEKEIIFYDLTAEKQPHEKVSFSKFRIKIKSYDFSPNTIRPK